MLTCNLSFSLSSSLLPQTRLNSIPAEMPQAHVCTPGGGDPTVKSPAFPQRPSLVLSSDASFPVTIRVEYLFFSFPFQFRASDKIAKRKKAGCSCKTPGLLMRRPLSIPDLSGQHRTPLTTSPFPPQQAGASWEQFLLQSLDSSRLSYAMCILCAFICLVISLFAEKYDCAQVESKGSLVLVNRHAPRNPALMNL